MQISFFDGSQPLKLNKPIRLIELFAGYGSQALALKYLGVQFEHWRICEWEIKSIQAYKDLHFEADKTDYSAPMSADEVYEALSNAGISSDYETAMTSAQVRRLGEKRARVIYNNIKATNNLVSITNAKADDFNITETDKYLYVMTYSYPCQDISNAGLYKGMKKGSGTRSALLWEVERILKDLKELPQILLMENVPGVLSGRNIGEFAEWLKVLDGLGYKTKWQKLNATDFGVPQNRERLFAVSVLGDYYFDFPNKKGCNTPLRELLETDVDERYYLKGKVVLSLIEHKKKQEAKGNTFGWKPQKIGGGGQPELLRPKVAGVQVQTLSLKNKATEFERLTETSSALCARDYKGYGNQQATAVMEIEE